MPLLPTPDSQTLRDHLFGSGAFQFGWFQINENNPFEQEIGYHFPAIINYLEEGEVIEVKGFSEEDFINGMKSYAELLNDRTFSDLVEDMDALDVDAIIQLMFWGEIRLF